jgi:hypothetical protein
MEELYNENILSNEEKSFMNLFLLSFYYSQGDNFTQEDFFKWFVNKGLVKKEILLGSMPKYLMRIKPPSAHASLSEEEKSEGITEAWTLLQGTIKEDEERDIIDIERSIGEEIMERDLSNIKKGGRPNRNNGKQNTSNIMRDPYASFFREYIINLKPSGNIAFNALFESIKDTYANLQPENREIQTLHSLSKHWEEKHHGEKFFPSTPTP